MEDKECKACDRVPGAFAVFLGLVFLFIGFDLMFSGKLSGFLGPTRVIDSAETTTTDAKDNDDE